MIILTTGAESSHSKQRIADGQVYRGVCSNHICDLSVGDDAAQQPSIEVCPPSLNPKPLARRLRPQIRKLDEGLAVQCLKVQGWRFRSMVAKLYPQKNPPNIGANV